ncbi:24788_t:CDS:1, partial [Cetraspora pellucida]
KDTKIGLHYLIWTPNQENDLLVDIMSFTSIIILEIQNQFPNDPFVEAIGIFKLSAELLNNENLLEF